MVDSIDYITTGGSGMLDLVHAQGRDTIKVGVFFTLCIEKTPTFIVPRPCGSCVPILLFEADVSLIDYILFTST